KILLQWLQQMQKTYCKKTSELDTALKCDDISLLWRQKGNEKFRNNLVEDSYKCYTNSVLYAKHNGLMYTLALANRSAALLRMKRFEECLSDIDLAIEHGYPIEQRHKLLLRRSDCYVELHQRTKASLSLDAAIQHANSLELSATNSCKYIVLFIFCIDINFVIMNYIHKPRPLKIVLGKGLIYRDNSSKNCEGCSLQILELPFSILISCAEHLCKWYMELKLTF
ncbi:jg23288, partial [Pararge aegeria aegeria]